MFSHTWVKHYPKYKIYELKIYRELCVMTMKDDSKFEQELTGHFEIDMRNLMIFDPSTQKSQKTCTLIGWFWPKYIMFKINKYKVVMFDGTEYWCKLWTKTDLCLQKWHEEFDKFSSEHVWNSKNWDFYWVLSSKVENVWA